MLSHTHCFALVNQHVSIFTSSRRKVHTDPTVPPPWNYDFYEVKPTLLLPDGASPRPPFLKPSLSLGKANTFADHGLTSPLIKPSLLLSDTNTFATRWYLAKASPFIKLLFFLNNFEHFCYQMVSHALFCSGKSWCVKLHSEQSKVVYIHL